MTLPIAAMIRLVDKIGRRRVQGDADRTPVLLVLDEFTNLVIRKLLPDDVLAALPAIAMEYAGVGVHGIIIGHDWNGRLLGSDRGAALRRTITHRLVCRTDAQNAEFLLSNAALRRQAAGLPKGQALYWGSEAPAVIRIPPPGHGGSHLRGAGCGPAAVRTIAASSCANVCAAEVVSIRRGADYLGRATSPRTPDRAPA
jgi:hypothetical protein